MFVFLHILLNSRNEPHVYIGSKNYFVRLCSWELCLVRPIFGGDFAFVTIFSSFLTKLTKGRKYVFRNGLKATNKIENMVSIISHCESRVLSENSAQYGVTLDVTMF